ncbi:MAG TPA: MFS transporter [Burkholderiaceae bacterium]|nr:MFS transporter [Burkholderiaceae bacterium]
MKIFYGWRMVGAASGIQFIQAGLLQQAFGAYVAVLTDERGWSKTALSGAAALQSVEAALLGPALGWIVDRFGAQVMIRAGILMFGLGFLLLSQIDSLGMFYAAIVVMAIGTSLSGFFPLTVAIIQWFEKKRARALATMGLGLAIGGIFVPVVAWSIQTFGWRITAFASGVLAIAIGMPLAGMIRRRPEDYGETVDGLPPQAAADASATGEPLDAREFTVGEALRTSAFWLISLGHGVALLVVTAVNVHAINHMKSGLGYSIEQASLVITLMTVSQVVGVMLGWTIGDRAEKRTLAAVCMLMHAVGLLMLTYAQGWPLLAAFAVLHGVAWGLRGPLMQAIRADYFGRRSIGMILGLSTALIAIGQVGGPMVAGVTADMTGDYRVGFTLLAVIVGLGSALFVFAKRPPPPQRA